ncbi:fructose-specific PTS transporter subunit EIIC [Collinsella sp. LCP19S3_C6]|jgi:fructose-specific phosphotransferase system IIC component/fructose-specific phosphotransferase system IIA component/fructose-specific phosphotransferase system IIB component|uniref:fructose-specific PTS transporter subunit EIIC n=1 Tax=unclassified Collinsella TaxID=2637548 RepID=UPI002A310805|nr:fructose-specific PTS transporter subunit EIIC [Collinsella sp.]MDD6557173.1 fructose-specific PTS transporter subunit EIIC [Collinsella sp.]MDD6997657.1 fructose-specific PTS transporter subunit EIIC [Collinsella sp.]MDD7106759.1 fructose-specific PTS transporter subunit EIIC [Collinsella sp.]MDD7108826.1 fructose-specific PTS transporter subunit EIIC [Collinsella sp.]
MAKFDIIAATGCPTGIAHTFMAKEALEKAAAERGLTIKVETHGQVGVENELTKGEIAGAKAVVVAADKDVQAERFAGKPMVSVGVSKALSVEAAGKLIDRALAAKGDDTVAAAADVEDEVEEKESIGHIIYKHLMNGVSHMLVFVVAGGVLTAVSFLWGITSFDSTAADYNSFAAMLKIIGGIAMNLMVPVLSAYIAESIGKRPALVPGFVAGMIAIQGLPVNAETGMIDAGGAGVGFGFLGGIVGGFLSGYVILLLEKVFAKLPKNLDGLKAIFLYPLFSTAIVGLVMLGISGPMAAINTAMMDFLKGLSASGAVVLGLAIGCMCAFDMGGPVNKAAYVTGTAMLTEALAAGVGTDTYNFGTNFMAAVSAACIVPPLITTFAVIVGKKYFSQEDHDAGIVNLILGCTHITEGAIPFMTKNIWPVMPIMMLGSSIASILTIMFNVHDPAPHGGFLVLPVVENGPLWVLAILIGAVVGGILFVAFKKYDFEKNQKAAPAAAAKPVEAPKAAAVEAPKAEASDFVKVENVFVAEDFASRDEALSFVSNQAVKAGIADDADAVMNAFLAREAEGTTGMMEGFAIPHAKSDAITEAAVIVVKDDSGVTGWDTMDGAPVNVAIALLIPGAQAGTTHLKILSKVAEALMDEGFRATVKGSTDAAEIAKTINARLV